MKLFAWVGEDEYGSGVVGIKQAITAAGVIPLACIEADRHKLERPELVAQLQAQATRFGRTIQFVEFEAVSVKRELT